MPKPTNAKTFSLLTLAISTLPSVVPGVARASYVSTVAANGAKDYYRLADTNTTASDSGSPGGVSGTYVGTSGTNYMQGQSGIPGDPTGAAVTFNTSVGATSGGYVNVGYTSGSGPITGFPFSIVAYFKTTTGGSDGSPEIADLSSTTDTSSNYAVGVFTTGTSGAAPYDAALTVRDSGTKTVISGTTNVANGAWHQIVGVFTSTTSSLYVDGSFVTSGTSQGFPTDFNTFGIGDNDRAATTDFFGGTVSEVSLYNTALTATQITSDFQASGVPEPTSISMLGVGGLLLLSRRRRA